MAGGAGHRAYDAKAVSSKRSLGFRVAAAGDAPAVAHLHAQSWRLHYRGAYADSFLDGDVLSDRLGVWSERLRQPGPDARTIVAEDGRLVGFAHVVFDEHPTWGSLLDNMHVEASHKRRGIGSRLLSLAAEAVLERGNGSAGLYLWVLEQNADARAFYESHGGACVGRERVSPPGGVAGRLAGSPLKFRYSWASPAILASGAKRS